MGKNITIQLTKQCNQRCIYCYSKCDESKKLEDSISTKVIKKIISDIDKLKDKEINIILTGGEPLLVYDKVKYIVKKVNGIDNKEINIILLTNLTLLNKSIIKFLHDNNIYVTISIDGPYFLHNKNRGNTEKSYNKIISNINLLNKNNINYNLSATITKESLNYPKEIVDLYQNLDCKIITIRILDNLGTAQKNWNKAGYESKEFLDFWRKYLDYIIKLNLEGNNIVDFGTTVLIARMINKNAFQNVSPICYGGTRTISYDIKGEIYPCEECIISNNFKLKNKIFKEGLEKYSKICKNCKLNEICGICPIKMYDLKKEKFDLNKQKMYCEINKKRYEILKKLMEDKSIENIFLRWAKESREIK